MTFVYVKPLPSAWLPECYLVVLFPWFLPSSLTVLELMCIQGPCLPQEGESWKFVWLNSNPAKAKFIYKQSEHADSISFILYIRFIWKIYSVYQGHIWWPSEMAFLFLLVRNVTYVQKSTGKKKTCMARRIIMNTPKHCQPSLLLKYKWSPTFLLSNSC